MPVAENAKQQEVAREASAAAAVAAEGGASAASASAGAGAGAAAAGDDDDEVVLLNASSPCGLVRCDLFHSIMTELSTLNDSMFIYYY